MARRLLRRTMGTGDQTKEITRGGSAVSEALNTSTSCGSEDSLV